MTDQPPTFPGVTGHPVEPTPPVPSGESAPPSLEERLRAAAQAAGVGSTHWQGCEAEHKWCAVLVVLDELARLRTEVARLEALRERLARGEASDGYHTHRELYEYRMLYNAHAARGWLASGYPVVKSWRHSDGERCFGGGWFIIVASLPTGQVSNHYREEHWNLFDVPEVELPPEYDGHTPAEAAERLRAALAAPPAPVERERERILAAIDAEPEPAGEMPDRMWEKIRSDRVWATEMVRATVEETKRGIRARILAALAAPVEGERERAVQMFDEYAELVAGVFRRAVETATAMLRKEGGDALALLKCALAEEIRVANEMEERIRHRLTSHPVQGAGGGYPSRPCCLETAGVAYARGFADAQDFVARDGLASAPSEEGAGGGEREGDEEYDDGSVRCTCEWADPNNGKVEAVGPMEVDLCCRVHGARGGWPLGGLLEDRALAKYHRENCASPAPSAPEEEP